MGNNDFRYTGHAANSLSRYNSALGFREAYADYLLSQAFKNNMSKFVRSNLQIPMTIKTDMIITNPLQLIKIKNYPYFDFDNKLMTIENLKCDPLRSGSEIKVLV